MNGKLKKALSLTLSAMLVLGATSVSTMAEDNSVATETQESENHVASTLSTNIEERDFYVGVPTEFTFTTTANDDAGTMVIGTSNFSDSDAIEKLEYEGSYGVWYDLKGDFGSSTGFPMSNATSRFRVTFKKAGNYSFTASMKTADGENVLCSTKVDFEVKENLGAATVGDTAYDDLRNAISAADNSDTDKVVKLIRNIETDDSILIIPAGVSLDGNNHTITYTGSQASGLNGGIITVTDNWEKGVTNISNLTLKSDANARFGIVYIGDKDNKLSGTISNCTINCPGAQYGIYAQGADLSIENSKLYRGGEAYIYYSTGISKIHKLTLSGIETEIPHKPDVEYNIVDDEWQAIGRLDFNWRPLVMVSDGTLDSVKTATGVESDAEAVKELNKYITGVKIALYKNEDNGKVWAEELVETGRMKLNEESFDFDLNSDKTTADVIIKKIENYISNSQVMRFDFTSSDENVVKVTDIGLTEYEDDFASIEAVGVGEAEITATAYANDDDVIGTVKCKVTVTDTAPTSVSLKNKEITLTSTGATFTLEPKIEHKKETDKVTWTSSNENVATVDNNGVVTAVSEGTAVITVKVGEATDTCKVTVEYPEVIMPVESIKLNTEKVTLTSSGATFALEVNAEPENTTDKNITFTSSNEKVATVDSNGVITAVGEGEAVITVKIGDVTAEVKVVVSYNNGSSSSSKKEDESDSSSSNSSSGSTSGGGSGSSSSSSTSGGGGGSASKPAEIVVGTVEAPENTEVSTEASSKATNEAALASAKDTANIDLAVEEGTSVDSKDFTEPVILSVPVDTKDVKNVNNLTLAMFNAETGKFEIVGGTYNAETKAVAGYINTSGDYFVVEKDDLVTITLQIGNSDASLNNADKQLDAAPIISDDRTMVPVRFIAEAFGAEVNWIEDTKTVEIILGDKVLTMQIDKEIEGFGAAPVISNNRTMVPIRYISENFGANVIWIPSTQTIAIAK